MTMMQQHIVRYDILHVLKIPINQLRTTFKLVRIFNLLEFVNA